MYKECFTCDVKQAEKIAKLLSLPDAKQEELENIIKDYLKTVDMKKTNPEVMGDLWSLFRDFTGIDDPYKEIKHYYNQEVMKCSSEIRNIITSSDDPFITALKAAITGNLIDFSASHSFDMVLLKKMLHELLQKNLKIDDSEKLRHDLQKAQQVLYIGDNCGEIVLDKLFIQVLKELYPQLHITFAVRGYPIANDITHVDAAEVGMAEVADIIDNGDGSMGVVLEKADSQFQEHFAKADVIIGKGQGNYEGLLPCENDHLYFLFMAKCRLIAAPLHAEVMDIICMKRSRVMNS